ncbi:MAG: ATP-binding protein, partial [Kofleriaceae bacterium]
MEALKELAREVGLAMPGVSAEQTAEELKTFHARRRIEELLTEATHFYCDGMTGGLRHEYWERGFTDESIDHFQLGFGKTGLWQHFEKLGVSEEERLSTGLFIKRKSGENAEFFAFVTEDDTGFLRQIGVLRTERGQTDLGLTLGGLLMLGRELAIRDRFPAWHLSYRELPTEPSVDLRWVDRVVSDGSWNANFFEFYTRIVLKLYEGLKVPFALEGSQFRVDETPAHKAVREALVNMLIHADYEGNSGIRVLRDPAGFEFINPGLLLVTPDQVWKGGVSEPRNPLVQRLFGFIQLGEREGSGGPTILRAWSEQHWQTPELVEDVENNELHLKLRLVSLLPKESVDAVRAALGAAFDAQDEIG